MSEIHVTEQETNLEYDIYIAQNEGSGSDLYVGSRELEQGIYTINSIETPGETSDSYTFDFNPEKEEFEIQKELVTTTEIYFSKTAIERYFKSYSYRC